MTTTRTLLEVLTLLNAAITTFSRGTWRCAEAASALERRWCPVGAGAHRMPHRAGAGDDRSVKRVVVRVTSVRDGREHLVAEEAMAPGSAGRYPALCGHAVWAAVLTCPPGPPCRKCLALRSPRTTSGRRRHRKPRLGLWAWLSPTRRRTYEGGGTRFVRPATAARVPPDGS